MEAKRISLNSLKIKKVIGRANKCNWWQLPNNLKILIADDDITSQKLAYNMLRKINIDADIATGGREAVNASINKTYDIILMDIQMPIVNGLDATKEILKPIGQNKKPIVIAITSNSTIQDKEKCLEAGMKDFIRKPIAIDLLINTIKKIDESIHRWEFAFSNL